MTRENELRAAIVRAGYTMEQVAKALMLSAGGFWKKLTNRSEFTATEIKKLQELLHLTNAERDYIFFATNSD